ncbi:hypothetical protein FPI77_21435 [Klebsiella quasivariicola]|nr:hypothetical protein FPI77_21435 [Klebsiella quasivariicola]
MKTQPATGETYPKSDLFNKAADTPQPEIPDNLTWGQSLDLNVSLLSALGQCNRDKADIRKSDESRGN